MIEGVLIQDIDATDNYRRFILLKMVLKKAMEDSLLEETQQYKKYAQLEKQLDSLEELVSTKNQKVQTRVGETVLRIDELHSQLNHMIPKVRQKKESFEGDLLKRWRGALAAKKKKEEQTKKQKDAKSTSNKNLMYLTSELLKKERISAYNFINHKQKVQEIQNNIDQKLKQADKQFKDKFDSLRKLMNKQKSKVDQLIKQYKQSLTAQQKQFKAEYKRVLTRIEQKLKGENQVFHINAKKIKQLISILQSRRT